MLALATGVDQETAATAVSVAALWCLGAAALGRRWVGLTAEALAVLGLGACAVVAVPGSGRVGLVVAGSALAAHSVWDVVHHRRDVVVPRSLVEAGIALDLPVGGVSSCMRSTGAAAGCHPGLSGVRAAGECSGAPPPPSRVRRQGRRVQGQ
ncbi:hypothetical protein [Modestobacter marinus]|uniref:hypothetical protein n=1 Tax=Modestobacter marinus TaxID=477641 RepID=UPI001C9685C2|nr:hypothetical protein [Modestobacter marinus]